MKPVGMTVRDFMLVFEMKSQDIANIFRIDGPSTH